MGILADQAMKEIHFYTARPPEGCYTTWVETEMALYMGEDVIHTTQMGLLHTQLFDQDYAVFIHGLNDSVYEIKLGPDNERTKREIKMGQNLFKMWQAGEFDKKPERRKQP